MTEENQGRNTNKNLEAGIQAESGRNAAYWLVLCGVLSLFSYITQNSQPRGGTAYSGLGPLTSVINQENAPQPSLMEAFSELRFLFTNDPGLCQVDRNNQHRQ